MRLLQIAPVVTLALTASCFPVDSKPSIMQSTWTYLGCYADNTPSRILPHSQVVSGANGLTHESCQTACLTAGFSISGTEYAGECWCGNSFSSGGAPASDGSAKCTMPCKGNSAQICGGSNRLSVYQYSPSSSPAAGKRGLAYNDDNVNKTAVFANMFKPYSKTSWGYDWGYPSHGLDPLFEFVPMLWDKPSGATSDYAKTWSAAILPNTTHILGFNEPDLTYDSSSNMLPSVAADGYKTYMQPFAEKTKVSTPNVLWNNDRSWSSGGDYNSRVWMQYFMGNCTGCHFDFAAIHYYQECNPSTPSSSSDSQTGADWFIGNVTNAYNTMKLPVWITEFECYGTENQQVAFLQKVLPWLDAQKWVERYAYFGVFPGYLINKDGTGLSELGVTYATT